MPRSIRTMHHVPYPQQAFRNVALQCLQPCVTPKVGAFSDTVILFPVTWLHMSSDVATSHIIHCFTSISIGIILHRRNRIKRQAHFISQQHAVNVAQQSDFRRILCSQEQSKLCLRPTKSFLSDKDLPCPPSRSGEFLQSRNSGKGKKYEPNLQRK